MILVNYLLCYIQYLGIVCCDLRWSKKHKNYERTYKRKASEADLGFSDEDNANNDAEDGINIPGDYDTPSDDAATAEELNNEICEDGRVGHL